MSMGQLSSGTWSSLAPFSLGGNVCKNASFIPLWDSIVSVDATKTWRQRIAWKETDVNEEMSKLAILAFCNLRELYILLYNSKLCG